MKAMCRLLFLLLLPYSMAAADENPWHITDSAAWINWKVVEAPWRVVDGQTNFVPRARGWYHCQATVVQVTPEGLLVTLSAGRKTGNFVRSELCLLKNYPLPVVDGSILSGFTAKHGADYSYTTLLGARKTIRSFDFGKPCQAPEKAL